MFGHRYLPGCQHPKKSLGSYNLEENIQPNYTEKIAAMFWKNDFCISMVWIGPAKDNFELRELRESN